MIADAPKTPLPSRRQSRRRPSAMRRAIDRFESNGDRASFRIIGGSRVKCLECQRDFAPEEVDLVDLERVDVTTDPDDQSVVAHLECPACHARGTHVFSYGPGGDPRESEAFSRLHDLRKMA